MTASKQRRSFDDWLGGSPIHPQRSSLNLGWSLVTVQTVNTLPTLDYYKGPDLDGHALSIIFSGLAQSDVYFNDVRKTHMQDVFRAGVLSFVPQNTDFEGRWDKSLYAGLWRFQNAAFRELGGELLRADSDKIEIPLIFKMYDPLLYQLSLAMLQELEYDSPCGSLYADSLATTMILHLLSRFSNLPKRSISIRGKLSLEQKYRLEEYIDTHLPLKITLSELASLLHLSIPHLCRLFLATFGMPVYKYVIYKRVERAKVLLLDKNRPLFEVALDCGFATQSHFNHHFKLIVGITPKQFAHAIT